MTTASVDAFVNFYEILGLPPTSDAATIEQKIKAETRIWRKRQGSPDLGKRQEAELRMEHLSAARDVLLDTSKKAAFDRKLSTYQPPVQQSGGPAAGSRNWVRLAEQYLAKNDYHSAAYAAREATQTTGNVARAWNLRARANAGLGRLDDAMYEARQAAEIEANNAQYHFDLGGILEQKQRWSDALASYETAARLDSANFVYRVSVAGVYLQNDRPQEALTILEQVYREHPNEEMVNYYLASCLGDLAERVPRVRRDDGYWITSLDEIDRMERLLQRAMGLKHGDPDLRDELIKTMSYVNSCRATKFSPPPALFAFGIRGIAILLFVPLIMVLGGLSGLFGGSPGVGLFFLVIGGLAIFGLVKLCWVPVWKANKRLH